MDKLQSILEAHVASGEDTKDKLLGAAFVVVNKDEVLYSGGAGRIDVPTDSRKFGPDSFTWVASLTKIITVTAVMQLVERKAVGLDDDMKDLIPELAKMQILRGFDADDKPILEDNPKPITLRNLLTHTLGLGYDLADPDLVKWSKAVGRTANNLQWSKEGFNTPIKFAPGEGWYYGAAVDWAGQVLEKITGQTLGAYMQENIFEPLGMRDTTFWPEKVPQTADRTVAYTFRIDGSLQPGSAPVPKEHEIESGGAGLFTTPHDYAIFLRGFLHGELLKEETINEMFRAQLNEVQAGMLELISYNIGIQDAFAPEFPKGLKLNHGIGGVLNMEGVPSKRRTGSMMWSGMCNSRWWIDRETGIAAALFVNVQPHGDPVVVSLYDALEKAVYEHLISK